jgi:hypothetical protein
MLAKLTTTAKYHYEKQLIKTLRSRLYAELHGTIQSNLEVDLRMKRFDALYGSPNQDNVGTIIMMNGLPSKLLKQMIWQTL